MRELKSKNYEKLKITVPKGARKHVESPPDLPSIPYMQLVAAKVGNGKSVYAANLIKQFQQARLADVVIWVSPTCESNKSLLDSIGVQHTLDPTKKGCVKKIQDIVDAERDDYVNYLDRRDAFESYSTAIRSHTPMDEIDPHMLLLATDGYGNPVKPTPKYDNAAFGRPQCVCVFDDAISTQLFEGNRGMLNLALRMRHLSPIPWVRGDSDRCGGIGLSCMFLTQSTRGCRGGIPPQIRKQITQLVLIGKTSSMKELKDITEEISGQVDSKEFEKIRQHVLTDRHACLYIDLNPKKSVPSIFRRGLGEYIIPDNVK